MIFPAMTRPSARVGVALRLTTFAAGKWSLTWTQEVRCLPTDLSGLRVLVPRQDAAGAVEELLMGRVEVLLEQLVRDVRAGRDHERAARAHGEGGDRDQPRLAAAHREDDPDLTVSSRGAEVLPQLRVGRLLGSPEPRVFLHAGGEGLEQVALHSFPCAHRLVWWQPVGRILGRNDLAGPVTPGILAGAGATAGPRRPHRLTVRRTSAEQRVGVTLLRRRTFEEVGPA
jgi:hypothetical protein